MTGRRGGGRRRRKMDRQGGGRGRGFFLQGRIIPHYILCKKKTLKSNYLRTIGIKWNIFFTKFSSEEYTRQRQSTSWTKQLNFFFLAPCTWVGPLLLDTLFLRSINSATAATLLRRLSLFLSLPAKEFLELFSYPLRYFRKLHASDPLKRGLALYYRAGAHW